MRRSIIVLIVLCASVNVFAQDQAIGLRIGNPIGIMYKRYLQNDRAIEFGIGTAGSAWNSNYYKKSFEDYNRYDNYDYRSHNVKGTLYLQGRYLFQYDIPIEGMVGELDWYWGIGAVLKFGRVDFTYQNQEFPYDIVKDSRADIDFGPEGIAGMEYTFEDIPLTVFGEVSLMLEFADRPLTFRPFAGVGARFNF
ncbi:MAG: hypothetical protein C0490_06615 [Marivirga sp.]|nr:hypothetical protein [Marivirga sp.]